jgi:hypothetical protein
MVGYLFVTQQMAAKTVGQVHEVEPAFIADTNMILNYCNKSIPHWNTTVDKIVHRGRKVFVLPRCASKYFQITNKALPDGFQEMAIPDEKEINVTNAFRDLQKLISDIDWKSFSDEEINLIKILLEAGHFAVCHVPLDQLLAGTVAIITSDNNVITKMLQEPSKAEKIEIVVNMNGLEHAIPLIQYNYDGNIKYFNL